MNYSPSQTSVLRNARVEVELDDSARQYVPPRYRKRGKVSDRVDWIIRDWIARRRQELESEPAKQSVA